MGTAQIDRVIYKKLVTYKENQKKLKHSHLIGDIYSLVFGLFDPFIKMEMLNAVRTVNGPPFLDCCVHDCEKRRKS